MLKKIWVLWVSVGLGLLMQQGFAASVASFWQIQTKKDSDAAVELERFLRLLFVEDEQTVELMKKALVTVESMQFQERLALLNSQDGQGNTFFNTVILSWRQVHPKNKVMYIDFLKLLISYGINLNRVNKQGNTALHLAYQVGSAEIAGVLELNEEVDQTITNKRGETARLQIVSPHYQAHEIPSIGENVYWCFKVLCIVHDGDCF